jgi:spermidine synthase
VLKDEYTPGERFALVIENRSGVVAVDRRGVVYGSGVYDGKFNVDPVHDTNGIIRAYAAAALRPEARDVLVVGLGSGSWTQVLANEPGVEHVTVIEINPAYVELLAYSRVVASLRTNPKVEFIVDDGRRWLMRNDRRFDTIVQNTTYHYRAHATNLLSREYFELCKQRLKPGGLLFYNTTHSLDAQRTGLAVFRHARLMHHGMYVSDAPLTLDPAAWTRMLAEWTIDGRRVVTPEQAAEVVARAEWLDREAIEQRTQHAVVITDDNMACEWN